MKKILFLALLITTTHTSFAQGKPLGPSDNPVSRADPHDTICIETGDVLVKMKIDSEKGIYIKMPDVVSGTDSFWIDERQLQAIERMRRTAPVIVYLLTGRVTGYVSKKVVAQTNDY